MNQIKFPGFICWSFREDIPSQDGGGHTFGTLCSALRARGTFRRVFHRESVPKSERASPTSPQVIRHYTEAPTAEYRDVAR